MYKVQKMAKMGVNLREALGNRTLVRGKVLVRVVGRLVVEYSGIMVFLISMSGMLVG